MSELFPRTHKIYLDNQGEIVYEKYRLLPNGAAINFEPLGEVVMPLGTWFIRNKITQKLEPQYLSDRFQFM